MRPYQLCTRCVMDTTVSDISFDKEGICNYCEEFLEKEGFIINENLIDKQTRLDNFISSIKKAGKGKKYDCIVGVSGGVDSSWVLVKAVEYGLRPLPVHMDNGWNSELAQNNISNLVNELGLDLYTHVIDWSEYRGLMQAFFEADVIDVELLYDNAMLAVNFQQAARFGIKHILSGYNKVTEGLLMPRSWSWHKYDLQNIKSIAKRFGGIKVNTFPGIGTLGRVWYEVINGKQWVSFLDYIDYNKFAAMDELTKRFKYKPYSHKHYESIFTRFYQGFILPQKFGIDKRRLHYSTLIISGQLSREAALNDLKGIPYQDANLLEEDILYFLKKMGWSKENLESYLRRPRVEHDVYPSERLFYEKLSKLYFKLKFN